LISEQKSQNSLSILSFTAIIVFFFLVLGILN